MVQEKNGEWGVPGGKIDRGEGPWEAAIRECNEELHQKAPQILGKGGEPDKFLWTHRNGSKTAFYAGCVSHIALPSPGHFRPTREIRAVRLVPFCEVRLMCEGDHPAMKMRDCARRSIAAILDAYHL